MVTIHESIKLFRTGLGLSQQAFAVDLGLSIRTIANYEGNRQPDARSLAQLAMLAKKNKFTDFHGIFHNALAEALGVDAVNLVPIPKRGYAVMLAPRKSRNKGATPTSERGSLCE